MSAFDMIVNAQSSRRGNGAKPGKYRLRVEKMLEKQGYKGHSFIVEARVIEALKTTDEEPSAVGSSVSFVCNMSKTGAAGDAAKGNAKDIVLALFGSLGGTPTKETYEKALANGSMRGVDAQVESYQTVIQTGPNAGKPFTGFTWSSLPHTKEQVLAQRAALDGGTVVTESKAGPAPAPKTVTMDAPKADVTAKGDDLDAILGL